MSLHAIRIALVDVQTRNNAAFDALNEKYGPAASVAQHELKMGDHVISTTKVGTFIVEADTEQAAREKLEAAVFALAARGMRVAIRRNYDENRPSDMEMALAYNRLRNQ